jgi:uncharacterized membrane protein SpoIIM required for sporulation
MKEARFIEQNQEKWKELEDLLKAKQRDSDKLSDLFIQVTDDLSYARTHYPSRVVRVYLNQITQTVFGQLYRKTSSQRKQMAAFWKTELPLSLYYGRKALLFSFILFALSFTIGVISSIYDPNFAASILGDSYISTTNSNINGNDPMAIYKDEHAIEMFFRIAVNNLTIALRTFMSGLLMAIGTVGVLIYNGIMVGVFQYFFIEKGLFIDSALAIWMHGTFEISAIIISGGAGLMLGKALVFPGTFTRIQSLKLAARSGIRIVILVVLMLFVAAIIESFITRYTSLNNVIRFALILLMLALVIFYTVIYPRIVFNKTSLQESEDQYLPADKLFNPMLDEVKSSSELFGTTFSTFFKLFGKIAVWMFTAAFLLTIVFVNNRFGILKWGDVVYKEFFFQKIKFLEIHSNYIFIPMYATVFGLLGFVVTRFWLKLVEPKRNLSIKNFTGKMFTSILLMLPFILLLLIDNWGVFLFALSLPIISLVSVSNFLSEKPAAEAISEGFGLLSNGFSAIFGLSLSIFVLSALMLLMGDFMPMLVNLDMVEMFFQLDSSDYMLYKSGIVVFFHFSSLLMAISLLTIGSIMLYYSLREQNLALGLKSKLQKAGLYNG